MKRFEKFFEKNSTKNSKEGSHDDYPKFLINLVHLSPILILTGQIICSFCTCQDWQDKISRKKNIQFKVTADLKRFSDSLMKINNTQKDWVVEVPPLPIRNSPFLYKPFPNSSHFYNKQDKRSIAVTGFPLYHAVNQ